MQQTKTVLGRIKSNSQKNKDEVFTRIFRYLKRTDIYEMAYANLRLNISREDFACCAIDMPESLEDGSFAALLKNTWLPGMDSRHPDVRLALVQESLRMVLESIFDPLFSNQSHMGRLGRDCHSALLSAQKDFSSCNWFITCNLQGCNYDPMGNLSAKIKDARFIALVRQFVNSGALQDFTLGRTYSQTALGGILYPILINICLDELDKRILEMGKDRFAIRHIRYGESLIIGIDGPKSKCGEVVSMLGQFCSEILNCKLSDGAISIKRASEKTQFLGYDISVKKTGGHMPSIQLSIPLESIVLRHAFAYGIVAQGKDGKLRYRHRPYLAYKPDYEILKIYNTQLCMLCSYYRFAGNYRKLGYFAYLMEYSCLKTLASKHKTSTSKYIKSHRCKSDRWHIVQVEGETSRMLRFARISECKKARKCCDIIPNNLLVASKQPVQKHIRVSF
ncbi:MAG: hypothetical protein FWG10_09510 [Eubacteriaceae bacterium]|nr:hypothetical protein [Eubacteriaceae bacterium]